MRGHQLGLAASSNTAVLYLLCGFYAMLCCCACVLSCDLSDVLGCTVLCRPVVFPFCALCCNLLCMSAAAVAGSAAYWTVGNSYIECLLNYGPCRLSQAMLFL